MLSKITDFRLNHLLMILIYNEELDEIKIKFITNELIKVKESRIATFGSDQFRAFAYLLLLLNPFFSMFPFNIP